MPGNADGVKPLEPHIRQVFIGWGDRTTDADEFERKLFAIRKQAHNMIKHRLPELIEGGYYYVPSMSGRTITYKGMMLAENLSVYYLDLV